MKRILAIYVLLAAFASSVLAHSFFISVTEAMAHKPGGVTASIGYGHAMPMDDFYMGSLLQSYEIYDPDMKKANLGFDPKANEGIEQRYAKEASKEFPSATIFEGDSFTRKIKFGNDSKVGTYQIAATTKRAHFSLWKDNKGRIKMGRVYLDEIKDAKEVIYSSNSQSFAKSFVKVGKWSEPAPLGHDLEIIPISDLSNVKVGDVVEFKVLFKGEPLNEMQDMNRKELRGYNSFFGDDSTYFVAGLVMNGKAKFRVVAPGQWLASISMQKPVDEKIAKDLIGKVRTIGYSATVTFFVHER
ncbi:DUF4198 domain-containing protein [Campylobacter sp.]|uniref:DUF4198 domain-containing protein n=1 Tax=Campylobacter sp. TaxID=205 RepID=UPI0026F71B04|nr:DUF4198 domain-containing protein [Campylobacter sp.]